jgi:undecaprenyl pyrophosphate synthase
MSSNTLTNPKHVGLIPDGSRRWARKNDRSYYEAYSLAMNVIVSFVDFMYARGVDAISIYLLSTDNLKRSQSDLKPVFETELDLLRKLLPPVVDSHNALVIHAGNSQLLPSDYALAMDNLCSNTKSHDKRTLYLLAAYNPLEEISLASKNGEDVSIGQLWVNLPLDMVVRTSGESRLSNFLPLQAGYAELVFTKKHLNDLKQEDFAKFLGTYHQRRRRFGG